jgi:HEAT repeat protein
MEEPQKYEKLKHVSLAEAREVLNSGSKSDKINAFFGLAEHEADNMEAVCLCIDWATSPDSELRRTVATCLGWIARIAKAPDYRVIVPVLERLLDDPIVDVREAAGHALSDVRVYGMPAPYDRSAIEKRLSTEDPALISATLFRFARSEPNKNIALDWVLKYLASSSVALRDAATEATLEIGANNPYLRARALNALRNIESDSHWYVRSICKSSLDILSGQ